MSSIGLRNCDLRNLGQRHDYGSRIEERCRDKRSSGPHFHNRTRNRSKFSIGTSFYFLHQQMPAHSSVLGMQSVVFPLEGYEPKSLTPREMVTALQTVPKLQDATQSYDSTLALDMSRIEKSCSNTAVLHRMLQSSGHVSHGHSSP